MLIETYKEKMESYYKETRCGIPHSTEQIILSFLRKKSLESTENTILFQEIKDYLKINKLVLKREIEQKNKTNDQLLLELFKSIVDISDDNKKYLNKHYKWKKIIKGVYPQLNSPNHTMLDLAALFCDVTSVKNFINDGCDVNISICYGMTPLMSACSEREDYTASSQCIKLLLQAGADCNLENEFKNTALGYACENGNKNAVKLLLAYGAKVNNNVLSIAKANNAWYKFGSGKCILDLLKQTTHSIIGNRHSFMMKMIDEGTSQYLYKDVVDLIASFDTRSHEPRYFKKVKNNTIEPLISDNEFLDTTQKKH